MHLCAMGMCVCKYAHMNYVLCIFICTEHLLSNSQNGLRTVNNYTLTLKHLILYCSHVYKNKI